MYDEKKYFQKLKFKTRFIQFLLFLPIFYLLLATVCAFIDKRSDFVFFLIPTLFFSFLFVLQIKNMQKEFNYRKNFQYFDKYTLPSSQTEYDSLLQNHGNTLFYHEEYIYNGICRYYIMTEDSILLFKIIDNQIYSPNNKNVGFLKSNFKLGSYVKLENLFTFSSSRNFFRNISFGIYKIRSLNLFFHTDKNRIYHNKEVFSTIKENSKEHLYTITFKNKQYHWIQLFLYISGNQDERTLTKIQNK